ncbi:FliI/YscN family ATPase [Candidatus Latescibacterota bacterium]
MDTLPFEAYNYAIKNALTIKRCGIVRETRGLLIESQGPQASVGEICRIELGERHNVLTEVVGFRDRSLLLMPLADLEGIAPGMKVSATGSPFMVNVGSELLGRVLDGFGNPIDGKGPIYVTGSMPLTGEKINPLIRNRITEPLWTQIRAIDGTVTIGKGQRIGIFSGSGVGKSILLGMIARRVLANVNVIALIGERGREVREFIENDLGEEGLRRSVIVVVTSDMPPILRLQGTKVAITIAEYFRSLGQDVVLMMDSITRVATAQREVGLSAGEPPTTKGYTPSVLALMPKILERAGASDKGTITGIYTVLVEGDDVNEPVSDTVRSIIDGHIILSRKLANRNHYPAIDILQSISRVQKDIIDEKHKRMLGQLIQMYADYSDAEDLINIGAYVEGSNPHIDRAINRIEHINEFLRQDIGEFTQSDEMLAGLENAVGEMK